MSDYYKLVGSKNPHTDWTTEVVLAVDDDGNVTKSVSSSVPSELSAGDKKKVEALGYSVEQVSQKEAEEALSAAGGVASDTSGAAPVFGTADNDQNK